MKAMPDDSRLPIRLLTLGEALLAFGLGCHFWADRRRLWGTERPKRKFVRQMILSEPVGNGRIV
jgi:hypothetical protein